ncbi:MAG: type III glutamate--ammonia ligase [Rhodobacteraceae bacterium]|nr:type III glutamate--ammonia ligase [Paracoccaceae bacterium]
MSDDFAARAKRLGIKFYMLGFCDLLGVVRSKLVPSSVINEAPEQGTGFAGYSAHLHMSAIDPDMTGIPDLSRMQQLPWQLDTAWAPCDLYFRDSLLRQAPRTILQNVINTASRAGYLFKTGVEPEFFLLTPDGTQIADPTDRQLKPCYDQNVLMHQHSVLTEICEGIRALGWEPYGIEHEDANGQYEINWGYADPLTTADRHCFFKFMVKSVASKHGLRATFMPKPFPELAGNGCHVHISVWDRDGSTNLFPGSGEYGLSDLAFHVIGGLLTQSRDMALITNPLLNSFRRLNAETTRSGATWSPRSVTFGNENRTHLVRIPDHDRIEYRLADGAANPYLLQAVTIAAALNGIQSNIPAGKGLEVNMYADPVDISGTPQLPHCFLEAIELFAKSHFIKSAFGDDFHGGYLTLKKQEWESFLESFSQWEHDNAIGV